MALFNVSRFRLKKVYGLPSWQGLVMFAMIGIAIWYSVANGSGIEQWIALFMMLLTLIHLLEGSEAFRELDISILPFDPPFADEECLIPVQISNSGRTPSQLLALRFKGSKSWTQSKAIDRNSSQILWVPFRFNKTGEQSIPSLSLKMSPPSKLFRFWRVIETQQKNFVLPPAVDHRVALPAFSGAESELELKELTQILDPRLLSKMDQKLFHKTGLAYMRTFESLSDEKSILLRWKDLETLPSEKQREQFSFWIKTVSEASSTNKILIEAPFFTTDRSPFSWRELKHNFSRWLHAHS